MRLHHYATPGSRAYAALDAVVHPAQRNAAPVWVLSCDEDVFEELIDIAARLSSDDVDILSKAFFSRS